MIVDMIILPILTVLYIKFSVKHPEVSGQKISKMHLLSPFVVKIGIMEREKPIKTK